MILQKKKKSISFIFKAFYLSNVDLLALSWLNMKTQKDKSPYLAPWGLIYDANIESLKLNVCIYDLATSFWLVFLVFFFCKNTNVGEF